MRMGTYRHQVTLLEPSTSRDDAGGKTEGYTQHVIWANVTSEKGDESFSTARQNAERIIKINTHWHDTVATHWSLDWEGERYAIIDVDRSMRHKGETWLMAKRGEAR